MVRPEHAFPAVGAGLEGPSQIFPLPPTPRRCMHSCREGPWLVSIRSLPRLTGSKSGNGRGAHLSLAMLPWPDENDSVAKLLQLAHTASLLKCLN